jgi:hypothetical protein
MLVVQMIRLTPQQMIWIGGTLLALGGVVIPLLMVIKILPSSFLLGFSSYAFSIVGMFMGLIGAFSHIKERRK